MAAQHNRARMFAVLSATNEAILRSTSEQDLYHDVCNAAVDGGKFLGTAIFLIEDDFFVVPDGRWGRSLRSFDRATSFFF